MRIQHGPRYTIPPTEDSIVMTGAEWTRFAEILRESENTREEGESIGQIANGYDPNDLITMYAEGEFGNQVRQWAYENSCLTDPIDKMQDGTATDDEILNWLDPSSNYPDKTMLQETANDIMQAAENRALEVSDPNFDWQQSWSKIAENLSRRYAIAADLYRRAEEQE